MRTPDRTGSGGPVNAAGPRQPPSAGESMRSPISMPILASLLLPLVGAQSSLAATQPPTDAEFEEWADAAASAAIDHRGASALAVALVRDGQLVYCKGFGHPDAGGTTAVDPYGTPFSIGSITKSFTATAVAQLLERGVIRSLDDPANRYLRRVRLPAPDGHEITVRNLLTHRGGLDESVFKLATFRKETVPISPEAILERLPPPARTPGVISVYSNIGYGVLGLLIEDVSGLTYRDYLKRNILEPLGMAHSFVRYDPREPLAQPMEYQADGTAEPIPQSWAYHPFISSSASVVSTAGDMAKFALAHLQAERGAATQLVNADTAHLLHDRSTANAPYVAGFGLSFIANTWNGTRVSENAGSGPGFQALFILLPDRQVGFIALIAGGAADPGLMDSLRARLRGSAAPADPSLKMFAMRQQFLNFYLGPMTPVSGPASPLPLKSYTGIYRSDRRAHVTSEAFIMNGTTLDVRLDGTDALNINGQGGYRQVAANAFWKRGVVPYVPDDASSDLYVFVPDANGKIRYVAPYLSVDVYEPAYLAPATANWLMLALCLTCATGLLAVRWRVTTRTARLTRATAVALGCAALLAPLCLALALWKFGSPVFMIGFGSLLLLKTETILATGSAVLVIALAALYVTHRVAATGGPAATPVGTTDAVSGAVVNDLSARIRAHVLLLIAAGIALASLFAHYNLIGDHLP